MLCALYVVIKQQFFTLISSNARMEYGPDSINQPRLNSIPTYTHNTTGIQLVQQTQHYITLHHPPCVGFDNAAVGLLQLGVRGPAAVDSRALQRVQNAAARLVFDLHHRDHVSPYLMQLHWVPVRSRVQFKLCTFVHAIHNKRSPSYLSDTV